MHFVKWQALGNDFVFVNGFKEKLEEVTKHTKEICDRHFGIGADGIIFVLPSDKADLKMRIFNSDGSEAEMCGNGIRAFAKWAHELGLVKEKRISVETGAGILYPEILDNGMVRVDMGCPHLDAKEIPAEGFGEGPIINQTLANEKNGKSYQVTCVSMGNPHCVIFVDDAEAVPVTEEGPNLETDPHFPKKTNVEFVEQLSPKHLRMRVWERGAGVTLACGTGTCATVAAAILNGRVSGGADVTLDGGQLHIEWDGNPKDHIFMTGPAEKVFEGDYLL